MIKDIAQIDNVKRVMVFEVGEGEPMFTTYFYTADGKKFLYNADEIKFKNINTAVWEAGEGIIFGKTASCKVQENRENNYMLRKIVCTETE